MSQSVSLNTVQTLKMLLVQARSQIVSTCRDTWMPTT